MFFSFFLFSAKVIYLNHPDGMCYLNAAGCVKCLLSVSLSLLRERVHVHTLYRFFVKILMNCGRLNMKLTKVKWSVDVGCVEV